MNFLSAARASRHMPLRWASLAATMCSMSVSVSFANHSSWMASRSRRVRRSSPPRDLPPVAVVVLPHVALAARVVVRPLVLHAESLEHRKRSLRIVHLTLAGGDGGKRESHGREDGHDGGVAAWSSADSACVPSVWCAVRSVVLGHGCPLENVGSAGGIALGRGRAQGPVSGGFRGALHESPSPGSLTSGFRRQLSFDRADESGYAGQDARIRGDTRRGAAAWSEFVGAPGWRYVDLAGLAGNNRHSFAILR